MKIKKILSIVAATTIAVAAMATSASAAVSVEGEAYLAFADDAWTAQYWADGKETDTLAATATNAKITGDGQYTVAIDYAGTDYADIGATGLAFMAVIVNGGTTLYPDMAITINSIKLDGTETTFKKNYTSSDNKIEMRANIYNSWVSALPEDAHTADGDISNASATIIDPAVIVGVKKVEVTFTVSGTGIGGTTDTESSTTDTESSTTDTTGNAATGSTAGIAVLGLALAGAALVATKKK